MTATTIQAPLELPLEPGVPVLVEPPERHGARQKPKTNRKADPTQSLGYDRCQTPPTAVHPLLPYLPAGAVIWECAAGEGHLADEMTRQGYPVIRSDILTGDSFYTYQPAVWDILVTNPPYSDKWNWLRRCYELGKPFALLVPAEARHNAKAHAIFHDFGVLPEEISLDRRINFKMPKKGWSGSAQFPVVWLCHRLLPQLIVLGHVPRLSEIYQGRLL
jgi:hypothetical protein